MSKQVTIGQIATALTKHVDKWFNSAQFSEMTGIIHKCAAQRLRVIVKNNPDYLETRKVGRFVEYKVSFEQILKMQEQEKLNVAKRGMCAEDSKLASIKPELTEKKRKGYDYLSSVKFI